MLKNLLRAIPLHTDNLSEGFVLVKEVGNIAYNKYAPFISAFRMDRKTFELTINKADLLSQPIVSVNEILKYLPNIQLPKPIKTYNDVKISSLLHDSEQSQEINDIKNQLRHYLYSGLITLEKVDYLIEVDKSRDNYVTYFLYDPIRYNTFHEELNKSLLNICRDWNNEEYTRLQKRIYELNSYPKSESAQKTSQYLDEVRFRFDEWSRNNGYEIQTVIDKRNNIDSTKQLSSSNSKKGRRINFRILYPKYIESNIRLMEKNKKLPNQKELSKFMNCSESTLSRMLNNKEDLTAISLLIVNVNNGKEQLPNFSTLDEQEKETLSILLDYFARTKANLIQPNFKKK